MVLCDLKQLLKGSQHFTSLQAKKKKENISKAVRIKTVIIRQIFFRNA